jgi:hypothetical protein
LAELRLAGSKAGPAALLLLNRSFTFLSHEIDASPTEKPIASASKQAAAALSTTQAATHSVRISAACLPYAHMPALSWLHPIQDVAWYMPTAVCQLLYASCHASLAAVNHHNVCCPRPPSPRFPPPARLPPPPKAEATQASGEAATLLPLLQWCLGCSRIDGAAFECGSDAIGPCVASRGSTAAHPMAGCYSGQQT